MPLYEYQCRKCGHRFEKIRKFSDPPFRKCPECGGVVEQLLSAPAVQFKGTGWYVTDYARKSGGASSESKPAEGATKQDGIAAAKTDGASAPKVEVVGGKQESKARSDSSKRKR